jgi:hypothetical protein
MTFFSGTLAGCSFRYYPQKKLSMDAGARNVFNSYAGKVKE